MATRRFPFGPGPTGAAIALAFCVGAAAYPAGVRATFPEQNPSAPADPLHGQDPSFARMLQEQAETDRTWRAASAGAMQMTKISYRSRLGDLDVPAFVFEPLAPRGPRAHPAIVWVHENIRGHLYEHYIPYVREAVARGFVVIAPEYRGSIGYGKAFYDAIDYGGAEVDDVVTAVGVLAARYPHVDPSRVAVIGWSHGGMIALLSIFRNPDAFKTAVAIVPVANLFHRLASKGREQRRAMDPQNRFGGLPFEKPQVYRERSPVFHVDKLRVPLLVHLAANDADVTLEEGSQLIDALRARQPHLAKTKMYERPAGGHMFDRLVNPNTWEPENTPEQRDSWNRVWSFLVPSLDPPGEGGGDRESAGSALTIQ